MKNRVVMLIACVAVVGMLSACTVPMNTGYYGQQYPQQYGQQYPQQVYPQQAVPVQSPVMGLMSNPVVTGLVGAAAGAGIGSWLTNRHAKHKQRDMSRDFRHQLNQQQQQMYRQQQQMQRQMQQQQQQMQRQMQQMQRTGTYRYR